MSKSTVTVAPVVLDEARAESVRADYRSADVKGKAAIRKETNQNFRDAVAAGDLAAGQFWMALESSLSPAKAEKVTVDPRLVIAQRVADLKQAVYLLESGEVIPSGLDFEPTDTDFVGGFLSLPDVEYTDEAAKLASVKLTRTQSGQRNSIAEVFARAFADKESGDFMTVSQIRRAGAVEGYEPSDGAIAARLFPQGDKPCTVEGVTPVEATATSPRGAAKA